MNKTSVVRIRTSPHSHHVFQIGRPQIEPVMSVNAAQSAPTSAEAPATTSHHTLRFHNTTAEPIVVTVKAR